MSQLFEWILHVDRHLEELITAWGAIWFYLIVFGIVFCETGLVVIPFLPGDSLLFAAGALCANTSLSLAVLIPLLIAAAIVGDAVNYWIGYQVGPRVFRSETSWWLNRKHLDRAQGFYERYGGKAIIFARFIPIVRTFAPFVAGIGKMHFGRFWMYNIVGAVAWVTLFLVAGYWFGNWEPIKKNFSYVTLGIIVVSVMPILIEWLIARKRQGE